MNEDELSSIANSIMKESKNLLEDFIDIFIKQNNVTINEIELVEQRFKTKVVWYLKIKEENNA